MDCNSKKLAYQKLIEQVREDYRSQPGGLKWCEDCVEINLWTYWQGNLDARILLVGQDWGCPWDAGSFAVMSNICKMNAGESIPYMLGNENPTDQNLIALFREIGYDLNSPTTSNQDLFFTNFVLGYRPKGSSGGFQKSWAKHDAPHFAALAAIIQPENILCLGRDTFESVLMAFGQPLPAPIRSYNRWIESDQNPVTISLPAQRPMRGFALAHCGKLGTMNRNRGQENKLSLQRQIDDWHKIR